MTAAVCLFALVASYQVIRQPFQPQLNAPTPAQATALARFARTEHVTYGSRGLLGCPRPDLDEQVRRQDLPGQPVRTADAVRLSVQHRRLELVHPAAQQPLDARSSTTGSSCRWSAPPTPAFGTPLNVATIGDLTVYVYPFDIAQRFQGKPPS